MLLFFNTYWAIRHSGVIQFCSLSRLEVKQKNLLTSVFTTPPIKLKHRGAMLQVLEELARRFNPQNIFIGTSVRRLLSLEHAHLFRRVFEQWRIVHVYIYLYIPARVMFLWGWETPRWFPIPPSRPVRRTWTTAPPARASVAWPAGTPMTSQGHVTGSRWISARRNTWRKWPHRYTYWCSVESSLFVGDQCSWFLRVILSPTNLCHHELLTI